MSVYIDTFQKLNIFKRGNAQVIDCIVNAIHMADYFGISLEYHAEKALPDQAVNSCKVIPLKGKAGHEKLVCQTRKKRCKAS